MLSYKSKQSEREAANAAAAKIMADKGQPLPKPDAKQLLEARKRG